MSRRTQIHRYSGLLLVGLFFLYPGCQTTPEQAEERIHLDIPTTWAAIGESHDAPDTEWPGELINPELESLIQSALLENRNLRASAVRLRQQMIRVEALYGERRPSVDASLGASRRRTVSRFDLPQIGTTDQRLTQSRYDLLLRVDWEMDLWGRLADAAAAAETEVTAARADLLGAELSISGEVSRLYYRILAMDRSISRQEALSTNLSHRQAILRNRIVSGNNLSAELKQIEGAIAQTSQQVKALKREKKEATSALAVLTGGFEFQPDALPNGPLPEVETVPEPGLPSSLISRRPDLIAAEQRLMAADFRLGEARKRLIPSLRLTAETGTSSFELRELFDRNFSVWALAGNLVQPIYHGGRLRREVEFVRQEIEALLMDFEDTLLNAFQEVETLLTWQDLLRAEAVQARASLKAAREAETIRRRQYQRGLADALQALEAEQSRIEAEQRRDDLSLLRIENRIALHLALGGSFTTRFLPSNPHEHHP